MTFATPAWLALLVLVPATIAAFIGWLVWRNSARKRLGAQPERRLLPWAAPLLLIVAVAFAAFAAGRPQWGHDEQQFDQSGIDLVVVMDVSQSMLSTDADPSRLERAQAETAALLDRLSGDHVGLVIFAAEPFVRSPLTGDLDALRRIVAGVDEERGLVPAGSDLGGAIQEATRQLEGGIAESKVILVISDGEDHGASIEGAINNVRRQGIRIYTAGAGTAAGAPVLDASETDELRPRVDASGQQVITRLDARQLQLIAASAEGRYVELNGQGRPLAGLAAEFDSLASTTFGAEPQPSMIDRYRIFAAIALALAVAATLLVRTPRVSARRAMRLWPVAGAGLLVGAVCSGGAFQANQLGNTRYSQGDFPGAVDAYRTAQALDPDAAQIAHNAGNALDRQGEYSSSIDETERGISQAGDDEDLQALLEYALGNHQANNEQISEAIEAYKRALLANPDDADAKHNLEVLLNRLARTVTATATPTPPAPEGTPTPADPGDGDPGQDGTPDNGQGDATAQATAGTADGTPEPGASDGDLSPEEVQRQLEQALQGIDEEFTVEEALRVLELLEQRNRDQLQAPDSGGGPRDY